MSDFSAWELETIFHLASNAAYNAPYPHYEKLNELGSKALKQQIKNFPEYNHGIKKIVEEALK